MRPTFLWLTLALTPAIPGQTALENLEKARTVHRHEGDLAAAIRLYRAVIDARQADAKVRTQAWLELASCLIGVGRRDEANAALQEAAKGAGPAAEQAKKQLTGEDDAQLGKRVQHLIGRLRNRKDVKSARNDLLWIGRRAAPHLDAAIQEHRLDLDFILRAVEVLLAMDGPQPISFLERVAKSDDVLMRRAVARSFAKVRVAGVKEELAKRIFAFVDDPDESVRKEALGSLIGSLPIDRIFAIHASATGEQRRWLFSTLAHSLGRTGGHPAFPIDPHPERSAERLAKMSYEMARRGDPTTMVALRNVWASSRSRRRLLATSEGQLAWLAWLETDTKLQLPGNDRSVPSLASCKPDPQRVLSCAQKLGVVSRRNASSPRFALFAAYVRQCLHVWGRAALPQVLGLAKLGYSRHDPSTFFNWVRIHAKAEDVPTIAGHVHDFYAASIAEWLAAQPVTADALPPLRKALEAVGHGKEQLRFAECLVTMLGKIRTNAAGEYAVEWVRRYPKLWWRVADMLQTWEGASPHLIALVALPASGQARRRDQILHRLIGRSVALRPELLVRAYELGLQASYSAGDPTGSFAVRGLMHLFRGSASEGYAHRYTSDRIVAILAACLDTRREAVWSDVRTMLNNPDAFTVPPAGITQVCQRVLEPPHNAFRRATVDDLLRNHAGSPDVLAMTKRLLASKDAADRRLVLSYLKPRKSPEQVALIRPLLDDADSSNVVRAARHLSQTGVTDVWKLLVPKLKHSSSDVRVEVLRAIAYTNAREATDHVVPLLEDPEWKVRAEAVQACERLLASKAVPGLLAALRDWSGEVRKRAAKALESIRFYNEQQEHWKKAFSGARTAGEALIAKAGPKSSKDIRRLAIQSLGALGDPKTLPFLFDLVEDEDRDIRVAALAAIHRINEKKK